MTDNPWLAIPAADYERHMGASGVDQLAPLRAIFADVYALTRPARLAMLGCGTGNALDTVDPAVTRRVVGVDLNPDYLEVARRRHPRLADVATWMCADVATREIEAASIDLIHAALLLEYVDPAPLLRGSPAGSRRAASSRSCSSFRATTPRSRRRASRACSRCPD